MKKRTVCAGGSHGWGMRGCTNPVSTQSPYWCEACDKARKEHISKQLEKLLVPATPDSARGEP